MIVYDLSDVKVGPREDTCQLHEVPGIDVSDDLPLVMLLVKNLFKSVILAHRKELRLRSDAIVALSLRCDVVATAASNDR